MSLALRAYALVASAFFPLLKNRLRKRHEVGFDERCGLYAADKLERIRRDAALWIHAVSVGEVQAASPLVSEAVRSGWDNPIVVSTVTETGAQNAAFLMDDKLTAHIYAPWDIPYIAARARRAVMPAAYVTVETEIWPNLLSELRSGGVPRFLLNARLSDRTLAMARYTRGALRETYDMFDLIMARGDEDADRLSALGVAAQKIVVAGDCKIDAILERRAPAIKSFPAWRQRLSMPEGTPCFIAGSTHEGEEDVVIEAFSRLSSDEEKCADARLLLVPRHPNRAKELKRRAAHLGSVALLSDTDTASGHGLPRRVVVVDEIGVLYELYGLATAAFVGGSLVDRGGQNILEPASWGVPIQHGTYMQDFAVPTRALDELGAASTVWNARDLGELWRASARGELAANAAKGASYLEGLSGASHLAWKNIYEYLHKNTTRVFPA